VRACVWDREELPDSSAARALRLWCALSGPGAFRSAWLASAAWPDALCALLALRQPTSADLAASVFPALRWGEGGSSGVLLGGSGFATDLRLLDQGLEQVGASPVWRLQAGSRLRGFWLSRGLGRPRLASWAPGGWRGARAPLERRQNARSDAGVAAAQVGALHAQVLASLCAEEEGACLPPPPNPTGSAIAAAADWRRGDGQCLRFFLHWLVVANCGALMDAPPPGLTGQCQWGCRARPAPPRPACGGRHSAACAVPLPGRLP
jgi:hypothetical protein